MKVNEIFKRALSLAEEGRLDDAEKAYMEALRVAEFPELWNNLGNVYRRKGLLSKAIECYENALKLDPHFRMAKVNLGAAFLEMGRYGEALLILESLLKSGDDSQETLLALAIAYEKSGRHADFIRIYRLIKLESKDEILKEYDISPPD